MGGKDSSISYVHGGGGLDFAGSGYLVDEYGKALIDSGEASVRNSRSVAAKRVSETLLDDLSVVALDGGGSVVGFLGSKSGGAFENREIIRITDVFVREELKGNGIFTEMLGRFMEGEIAPKEGSRSNRAPVFVGVTDVTSIIDHARKVGFRALPAGVFGKLKAPLGPVPFALREKQALISDPELALKLQQIEGGGVDMEGAAVDLGVADNKKFANGVAGLFQRNLGGIAKRVGGFFKSESTRPRK